MFVRIRGKGACPENSQAAVMHIRGFRHTHSAAPPESFFPLLNASLTPATAPGTTSYPSTSSSPAAQTSSISVEMRPFRFALFPVGIHAAALTEAQAKWMAHAAHTAADAADAADAPAVSSPLTVMDSEVARMVWKETWNLYDILYDEVPLLPWTEATSGTAAATAVSETVEAELRCLTEGEGTVTLSPLEALHAKTDDFKLASTRSGSRQVVVCPHYYASAALPEDTFRNVQKDIHATAAPTDGSVVVLDVSDLPVAQAGGKAMVNIAWLTAFAAMQPDSALLGCRAVVVRLPYAAVPSYTHALENCRHASGTTTSPAPTMADAFVEMVDFIGEHITAVRHAMVRELASKSAELAQKYAAAPPVLVMGSSPSAMSACLQALLVPSNSADAAADALPASSSGVVVLYGDHLGLGTDEAVNSAHELGVRKAAEYKAIGGSCACVVSIETMSVPLKALLDGGEEPWDEYTLRERQRLNFCPCCGDCGNEGESDGADHGHSHGHGHGHHH
jgi:hypothetical protein